MKKHRSSRFVPLFTAAYLAGLLLMGVSQQGLAQANGKVLTQKSTFSMYCYWQGEATLGTQPGVLSTKIGHQGFSEIVEVEYNPAVTDVAILVKALKNKNSFYSVIVSSKDEMEKVQASVKKSDIKYTRSKPRFIESKYSLRTQYPELYALDLSEPQLNALNSWAYYGGAMPDVLTDEQVERLKQQAEKK